MLMYFSCLFSGELFIFIFCKVPFIVLIFVGNLLYSLISCLDLCYGKLKAQLDGNNVCTERINKWLCVVLVILLYPVCYLYGCRDRLSNHMIQQIEMVMPLKQSCLFYIFFQSECPCLR